MKSANVISNKGQFPCFLYGSMINYNSHNIHCSFQHCMLVNTSHVDWNMSLVTLKLLISATLALRACFSLAPPLLLFQCFLHSWHHSSFCICLFAFLPPSSFYPLKWSAQGRTLDTDALPSVSQAGKKMRSEGTSQLFFQAQNILRKAELHLILTGLLDSLSVYSEARLWPKGSVLTNTKGINHSSKK